MRAAIVDGDDAGLGVSDEHIQVATREAQHRSERQACQRHRHLERGAGGPCGLQVREEGSGRAEVMPAS